MHTKMKTVFDVPTILNVKVVVVDEVVDVEVENVFMSKIFHYLYCI